MAKKRVKKRLRKTNFYLSIISSLKYTTNLSKIREKLNISKQQLNYYLRQLKKKGFVFNRDYGWWELTEKGKNPTKYGIFLKEDNVRGHAYIWETEIEKIPKNWNKRIELLKKKGINFKLAGALKTTPRIKVQGRKVWLCKDHLRIFDTEKSSYYGDDAKESRKISKLMAMRIVRACENKLGIKLNPNTIKFKKEHYALIKNQLAIDQNQKGVIWRIKDEEENEWMLIDNSLEQGGELETVGKKAFKTNPKLQNYWNSMKEDDFKTANPNNIKNKFAEIDSNINETVDRLKQSSQLMLDSEMRWKQLENRLKGQEVLIYQLVEEIRKLRK